MDVFYPELRSISSFHLKVLEKLRNRTFDGTVCFIAVMPPNNLNPRSPHESKERFIGTIEISPSDFRNTTIENVGHFNKLYVMDLAVRRDLRRMGVASRLLESVEMYARENQYREIYLHVEIENEAARRLYQKYGYVEVPETAWALEFTQKRLHKPPECYVLLWKEIFV